MICKFCKELIPEGREIAITSPDEKLDCCPLCMVDIVELMESGVLEDKSYKNYESILEIDNRYLFEPLANGRKRTFKNCKVIRVELRRNKYERGYYSSGGCRYDYDDKYCPYEVLIELYPNEEKINQDYLTKYIADFTLKP